MFFAPNFYLLIFAFINSSDDVPLSELLFQLECSALGNNTPFSHDHDTIADTLSLFHVVGCN